MYQLNKSIMKLGFWKLSNCVGVPHVLYFGDVQGGFGKAAVFDSFGVDLGSRVKDSIIVEPSFLKWVGAKMIDILESVHTAGVIHQDVKPTHIILKNGSLVLIDFGVAVTLEDIKHNKAHCVCTPRFASLASLMGRSPSAKDDLESLAYTLLFLGTGALPWDKCNELEHLAIKHNIRSMADKLFSALKIFSPMW